MRKYLFSGYILIILMTVLMLSIQCQKIPDIKTCTQVASFPEIEPDYAGIVIPPNIAPMNFTVKEPGVEYFVRIFAGKSDTIYIVSGGPAIKVPIASWKKLLGENRGEMFGIKVTIKKTDGSWKQYDTIMNRIADEEIDGFLVYRDINPLHNTYLNMVIRQRNLENFDESAVLKNNFIDNGCMNCHTFANNSPDNMLIHTRGWGESGVSMILVQEGESRIVNSRTTLLGSAPMAYSAWHPGGSLIAFSVNKVYQFQHSAGPEVRDVIDLYSELGIYSVERDAFLTPPAIAREDRLETYPAWSADGDYLYYCSAPVLWTEGVKSWPPRRYKEVKYDLMRISFDMDKNEWGAPETVLSADSTGRSIVVPRISPDGRFLLFCMCDYGCFPVFQPGSDLYMMDLVTGVVDRLGINSDYSESWHSWSTNSRWIAFSSKRMGGFFTRSFIAYVDKTGKAYKPFVLPQENPAYYESCLKTYSVPELIREPVDIRKRDIVNTRLTQRKRETSHTEDDSTEGRYY